MAGAGFALLLAGCVDGPDELPAALAPSARPIVLIVFDRAPGADALTAWSPEAVSFAWAFAQSSSAAPSHASLLTGLYPATHGVHTAGDHSRPNTVTLALTLQGAGYTTALISSATAAQRDPALRRGFALAANAADDDELAATAERWLGRNARARFFLTLHASGDGNAASGERTFIERVDAALRLHRLNRRTIVVVVANRGPGAAEEAFTLGATRVPMLVRLPGGPAGVLAEQAVEVVDLAPTLLELAGVPVPDAMQGDSLVPLLAGRAKPRSFAFSEGNAGASLAVVLAGWRLVRSAAGVALFDLGSDPGETADRAALEPHRVTVLVRHLDAWHAQALREGTGAVGPGDGEDESIEQLKNLGYIQ